MAASGGMRSVQDAEQHTEPDRFKGYRSKLLWRQHGTFLDYFISENLDACGFGSTEGPIACNPSV